MLHPAVRLKELETRARRRFGQNFLTNPDLAGRIVSAAGVRAGETVLEIGPGLGLLTESLVATGAAVTCIEMDRDLAAGLREIFPSVTLIEGDAMRVPLPDADRVVANLPYNVATPILMRLLERGYPVMVLMFQREVADRLAAGPDEDAFGALSVQVQARAEVTKVLTLPPGAFHPAPKVHSCVVRLARTADTLPPGFDRIVRLGFQHRRKTLANSLRSGLPKEEVARICEAAGVDPGVRAETLGLADWRKLAIAAGAR